MIVELGGKWANKKGALLAHTINESDKYVPLPFEVARNSTATCVGRDGLIKTVGIDEVRVDFSKVPEGSLSTEPQSTNLVLWSEDFSNVSWILEGGGANSIVKNNQSAPDGSLSADTVTSTGSGVVNVRQVTGTPSTLEAYVFTIYVRLISGDASNFQLFVRDNGISYNKNFTITDKWERVDLIVTFTLATSNIETFIRHSTGGDAQFAIWGAKLEQLSYPTSYIKTEGSTVTRLADSVINCGNDLVFNSEEGVLYAEISALVDDLTNRTVSISDGTGNNAIILRYDTVSNRIVYLFIVGGVTQANIDITSLDITDFNKIAVTWKLNEFKMFIGGVQIGSTDTSGIVPPINTFNVLNLASGTGSDSFRGNTKSVKAFQTALTDVELTRLTTNGYL